MWGLWSKYIRKFCKFRLCFYKTSGQGGAFLDDTHISAEIGKGRTQLTPNVFVGCRHMTREKLLILSTEESCKDRFNKALSKKNFQMLSESECL